MIKLCYTMLVRINPFVHKSHTEKKKVLTGQTRRVPDKLEASKGEFWPWWKWLVRKSTDRTAQEKPDTR